MNKFIKFVATLVLAFGITACGDDPKADYNKILEWNQQQQPVQQKLLGEFQASLAQVKTPEDVDVLLKKYEDGAKAIIDSLDKVDVKSKEIKEFKDKSKALLVLSADVAVKSVRASVKPLTEEEKTALQAQVSELQTSAKALAELDKVLVEKYGKADQAEKK